MEDETLFSWCSRFHRCASWSARTTSRVLFGTSGTAKFRTAPAGVARLVQVTGGALGDADAILRLRTVAGLQAAFVSGETGTAIHGGGAAQKYGSLTGLRYCASCLHEHRMMYGTGLWRIDHQLPGAAACTSHGEPLYWVHDGFFGWHLPADLPAQQTIFRSATEARSQLEACAFLSRIFRLAEHDIQILVRAALGLLCEHYRAYDAKRLDARRIEADWTRSSLGQWVAREAPSLRCCRPGWIADMLRGRCSERNPLRWAYLAAFMKELGLGGSEALFGSVPSSDEQAGLWRVEAGVAASVLHAFIRGGNFIEVARSLNVGVHSVRRWARIDPALRQAVLSWNQGPTGAAGNR